MEDNTGSAKDTSMDIAEIMLQIRERVKEDVEANRDTQKQFQGTAADFHATYKAGEIVNSEELRYLNTHYAYGPALNLDSIKSHRPGIIGKTIVKFKRKLLSMIWELLKDYFSAEKDYQANLVRLLNSFSKYVDARDAANFWELIRKLDYDINKISERVSQATDEENGTLFSTEQRIQNELNQIKQKLEIEIAKAGAEDAVQSERLATLERVTTGFEAILARLGKDVNVSTAASAEKKNEIPDFSYILLENRSRGSEEDIKQRLTIYPPLFKGSAKKVLEIGQGRGELLQLFKDNAVPAYGVDLDQAMTERAAAKGLEVYCGDALSHMRSLADDSLGGVIAIQVVEHLTTSQLEELITLCKQKVTAGGKIVFETVNPCSLLALSSNFYRDLTHVHPLHPDTLSYICQMAGLNVTEVRELSPVDPAAQLVEVPVEAYMTPHWAHTVELLNRNIKQLNAMLYGFQDYCVIAEA